MYTFVQSVGFFIQSFLINDFKKNEGNEVRDLILYLLLYFKKTKYGVSGICVITVNKIILT